MERHVSLRKLAANRANAKKSSGPRSIEGKAKSSMNALKHGLTAVGVVLDGEDPAQFESLRDRLILELKPQTALEEAMVDRISALLWRLRRVPVFEAALLAWLAHTEVKRHDCVLLMLGSTAIGDNDRALPSETVRLSRSPRLLGRMLESALSKRDLLVKLSRYEHQLMSQLEKSIKQLCQCRQQPLNPS